MSEPHTLPTGTVTFLFTDIEGSTRLLQQWGDEAYSRILADHWRLLRGAIEQGGGRELQDQGDGVLAVFPSAKEATLAAISAQRALAAHLWPDGALLGVRMALHTGEPVKAGDSYVGLDVHITARICQAGHGGQILSSRMTRELVKEDLPQGVSFKDLDEHRLRDLASPQHLFQMVAADLPHEFPPLKSLSNLPNNLPLQLTSFVGREREKVEIGRLLSTTRLLTLTGAGGVGKTRLALQVAAEVLEDYKDGVWLVELAPLTDAALVAQSVAAVLKIREEPNRPILTVLTECLKPKHLLLVWDNAERLLSACADLAYTLLRACPDLRILTTSQGALGVAGELTYWVPPLEVPDLRQTPRLDRLLEYEAVRLFLERVSFAVPTFKISDHNAAAVAEICHRLDGIPLALELAAARTKALSPEQIARRLGDRFRLLTGGARTSVPQHQTLRATMDWSYDLLTEPERTLLRRLSVFVGGFTLEAVESVCGRGGVSAFEGLDLLTQLVDKSLVFAEAQAGDLRYRLLETVRQYGWDRLIEASEAAALQAAHLDFFLAFVEEAEQHLQSSEGRLWLDRLETEHDNIRAAIQWSFESGDPEAAMRMSGALRWFWIIRGQWSEGQGWLDRSLSGATGVSSSILAKALYAAGLLANYIGDQERAAGMAEQSATLYRSLGDRNALGMALLLQGVVHRQMGEDDRANAYLGEALVLFQEIRNNWGIARSLWHLAMLNLEKNPRRAVVLCEESVTVFRRLGEKNGIGRALMSLAAAKRLMGQYSQAQECINQALAMGRELGDNYTSALALQELGTLLYVQGDSERGRQAIDESLALWRDIGSKHGIGSCLAALGIIDHLQGQYEQASARLEQALLLARELRWDTGLAAKCLYHLGRIAARRGQVDRATEHYRESLRLFWMRRLAADVAPCLEGLADVAARGGRENRAARLLGAAAALREALGVPLPPICTAEHEQQLMIVQSALGQETFSSVWAEGRAMTLGEAVEYALNEAPEQRTE